MLVRGLLLMLCICVLVLHVAEEDDRDGKRRSSWRPDEQNRPRFRPPSPPSAREYRGPSSPRRRYAIVDSALGSLGTLTNASHPSPHKLTTAISLPPPKYVA